MQPAILIFCLSFTLFGCASSPKTSAYQAIEDDDREALASIALNEPGVIEDLMNDFNYEGLNAFHRAAAKSADESIKYFIRSGVPVDVLALDGVTPLIVAIRSKASSTVKLLLSEGAATKQVFPFTASPLVESIDVHSNEITDELLERGADINEVDHLGRTALSVAAFRGNSALISKLLQAGANIDYQNAAGWRPIHFAAFSGHTALVQLLLSQGASGFPVASQNPGLEDYIASALTCAIAKQHKESTSANRSSAQQQCTADFETRATDAFDAEIASMKKRIAMTRIGNAAMAILGTAAAQSQAKSNTVITPSGQTVGVGTSVYPVSSTASLRYRIALYKSLKARFIAKLSSI